MIVSERRRRFSGRKFCIKNDPGRVKSASRRNSWASGLGNNPRMDPAEASNTDHSDDEERRLEENLRVGLRYRVSGILHEYLGPARLPDEAETVHVFLRNEWRPDTPGQLPLTLVAGAAVRQSVTKTGIGGADANRNRGMRTRRQ